MSGKQRDLGMGHLKIPRLWQGWTPAIIRPEVTSLQGVVPSWKRMSDFF
jgi:hypothetical protein